MEEEIIPFHFLKAVFATSALWAGAWLWSNGSVVETTYAVNWKSNNLLFVLRIAP